jgi:hypothetical protein
MNGFSASDAALEGFQVLRSHWRVVVGWCVFTVLGFVGLVVAAFIAIALVTIGATSPDQAGMLGGAAGGLVLGLGGAAIQWVVLAALYRMCLGPQSRLAPITCASARMKVACSGSGSRFCSRSCASSRRDSWWCDGWSISAPRPREPERWRS